MKLYRFTFTSPLHIGKGRLDYGSSETFIHSDSLYAAIAQAWAELGHEDWISQQADQSWGFVCSSLFPFQPRANGFSFYFPKPFSPITERTSEGNPQEAKSWKKLEWLDQESFQKIIAGHKLTSTEFIKSGCYQTENPNEWVAQQEKATSPFLSEIQSRNQVGQEGEDTKPFYTERIRFAPGGGLFGLFQFEDSTTQSRVELALKYLASSGLGTDRNVGNGQFNLSEAEPIPFKLPEGANTYGLSLSLLLPEDKEQFAVLFSDAKSGYDIKRRGGWISQPHLSLRKKQVWMVKEGAVLCFSDKNVLSSGIGATIDLAPSELQKQNRKVWRKGTALVVPIIVNP